MAIILASGSPRRRELMAYITENFEVKVSDADEATDLSLPPDKIVMSLAGQKNDAVLPLCEPDDIIISADTIVYVDGEILGKPKNHDDAKNMLSKLSGRTHEVYTGVFIRTPNGNAGFADKTEVRFYDLSSEEIDRYINTGEPFDKAGGYGIQGRGAMLIKGIVGDYYNVVGFPVAHVGRVLKQLNFI